MTYFQGIRLLVLMAVLFWIKTSAALELNKYPELKKITDQLVSQGLYTASEVENLFAKVNLKPDVVEAFKKPAEKLSWARYQDLFISDKVIQNGVAFWKKHQKTLARAAQQYGVPEEIIVAILGVETRFGKSKGNHAVINSLSTLSVDFERRKKFFQSELQDFLKLAKTEDIDPVTTVGSYAGAMGIPQFIASSYQAYAVDFDGNGKRDLINSFDDAIGSVANYFNRHKWVNNAPVKTPITKISSKQFNQFKQSAKSAQYTVSSITGSGVEVAGEYNGNLAADVIELDGKNGKQYELVFENFYVIKRYNQSNLYAMAVAELSDAIKARKES